MVRRKTRSRRGGEKNVIEVAAVKGQQAVDEITAFIKKHEGDIRGPGQNSIFSWADNADVARPLYNARAAAGLAKTADPGYGSLRAKWDELWFEFVERGSKQDQDPVEVLKQLLEKAKAIAAEAKMYDAKPDTNGGRRRKTRRARRAQVSRRGGRVDPKKEIQNAMDIATKKWRDIDRNTWDQVSTSLGHEISDAVEKAMGAYEGDRVMSQAIQRAVDFVKEIEDDSRTQTGRETATSLQDLIQWGEGFKMELEG